MWKNLQRLCFAHEIKIAQDHPVLSGPELWLDLQEFLTSSSFSTKVYCGL